MLIQSPQIIFLAVLLSATISTTQGQDVQEPKATNAEWSKSFPPFRIAGNLYYVGTYDLACYLITTTKGNILINTGLAASDTQIRNNIKTLGFQFSDTKILLTTQAHYDHVGAMAAIKELTGAQLMVDEKDAPAVMDGDRSDYAFGGNTSSFKPPKPDRLLHNGDTIALGNMQVVMLHHPGHTKGSCSYLFTVKDDRRSYRVLIANMPTIITEKRFTDIPAYPEIASDYAYTFNAMKNISFDIWLASHASQFKLHDKYKPGDTYNPTVFFDRDGYDAELNRLEKEYTEKVNQ
jgi:metallo-beta-lactamase class B